MATPIPLRELNENAIRILKEAQQYLGRREPPLEQKGFRQLYQDFQVATNWKYLERKESFESFQLACVAYRRNHLFNPYKSSSDELERKDSGFLHHIDGVSTKTQVQEPTNKQEFKNSLKDYVAEFRNGKWYARRAN